MIRFYSVTLFLILSLLSYSVSAQQKLADAFKNGKVRGNFRTYYFYEDNDGDLKDWNTVSMGGMLGYETAPFKKLSIGAAFYTSQDLGIGNTDELDPTTGRPSRYAQGNYDVEDISNREIYQLGELYLRFKTEKHHLQIGRMKQKNPFLNPEDGRMIPTLFQGIWYTNNSFKNWTLEAGVINAIFVRSSTKWYNPDNSFVYAQGRSVTGANASYRGNTGSDFIAVGHVQGKLTEHLTISVWDYYADNIFNTVYSELTYKRKIKDWDFFLGFEQAHQDRINDGGNADVNLAYFQDKQSNLYGGRLAMGKKGWTYGINVDHISAEGRFVFPREWGREFTYTFQKRERTEGSADVFNWVLDIEKKHKLKSGDAVSAKFGGGVYNRPDPTDAAKNKYAMPSNTQFNLDVFYHFNNTFEGLSIEGLVVYKGALDSNISNPNFILGKVDMTLYHLILNYRF